MIIILYISLISIIHFLILFLRCLFILCLKDVKLFKAVRTCFFMHDITARAWSNTVIFLSIPCLREYLQKGLSVGQAFCEFSAFCYL